MNRNTQNALFLAAGIVLLAGGGTVVYNQTRGLRLNNPFNIRHGSNWQGLAADQPDPDFCKFVDMKYGIRAGVILLRNYGSKYGLDTVAGIVNRWAPPSENDTAAYIADVAARVGVDPDQSIDVNDTAVLLPLLRALSIHENGAVANLVPDSTFYSGIALA